MNVRSKDCSCKQHKFLSRVTMVLTLIAMCLVISLVSSAQNWNQIMKKVASDKVSQANYGYSVAMRGDYAIVGCYKNNTDASGGSPRTEAGAAYILKRNHGGEDNWGQLKKIVASDRSADDYFGWAVSIDGDYAVVSATMNDRDASSANPISGAGAAYVFKKNQGGTENWGQIKKLVSTDRNTNEWFGQGVSIEGDYIVVGNPGDGHDSSGGNYLLKAGSAFIFKKDQGGIDNWGVIKKLLATDRKIGSRLGKHVMISGDDILVGAHGDAISSTQPFAGAVYMFKKDQGGSNNWGQFKKLVTPDRAKDDNFGTEFDMVGDYMVVGAYLEDHDVNGNNFVNSAGAAYIYKKDLGGTNNWGFLKKIVPSYRETGAFFSSALTMTSSGQVVIGAHGEDIIRSVGNAGTLYVFEKDEGGVDNWGETKIINASDKEDGDGFGYCLASYGDNIIVGARLDGEGLAFSSTVHDAGSAYVFTSRCTKNATLPTTPSTTYTGSYKDTDSAGWTHYCGENGHLLLSLKLGTSGAIVNADEIELKLGANTTKGYLGPDSGMISTGGNGYQMIDRKWSVDPTTQPVTGNLGVRYYFTNQEYEDLKSSLLNHGPGQNGSNKSTLSAVTDVRMYRGDTGTTAFADPHTMAGTVMDISSVPSTFDWAYRTHGSSDHAAEFEVASLTNGGSGGGGGGGVASGAMPVDLIHFAAKAHNPSTVILDWATASEINNSHFEVERSLDGKEYVRTGSVEGHGNSNSMHAYNYKDTKVPLGATMAYYRLKQVDYDGEFEYTQKRVVQFKSIDLTPAVQVYPNPIRNTLYVVAGSWVHNKTEVRLLDISGKQIKKFHVEPNSQPLKIDISDLRKGVYFIKTQVEEKNDYIKILKN